MPAAGRSNWCCGGCRHVVAHVRGEAPHRRLTAVWPARAIQREDGHIEITCPNCHKLNLFRWSKPSR